MTRTCGSKGLRNNRRSDAGRGALRVPAAALRAVWEADSKAEGPLQNRA